MVMAGAVWTPITGKSGNGTYSNSPGVGNKITLLTTGSLTVPPVWTNPPHITIDLRAGGYAYQHVEMNRPAYALTGSDLASGTLSANRDAGVNIEVAIVGYPQPHSLSWTAEQYRQLGWWLQTICNKHLIEAVSHSFGATAAAPNAYRLPWDQFRVAKGVLGMEHAPYDTGKYSPGAINTVMLMNAMKDNQAVPIAAATFGTSVIRQTEPVDEIVALTGVTTVGTSVDRGVTKTAPNSEVVRSGKAFRFNPPLHQHSLPVRVDLSRNTLYDAQAIQNEYFDERGWNRNVQTLRGLRLGRIIQSEVAAGMAATNAERYGFRFLYNPTSVTITSSRNDSVILDHQSAVSAAISGINQDFQHISFRMLLNREPDVINTDTSRAHYTPEIGDEDLAGLKKYGTHWDLEILYRLCNGVFTLKDRGRTSDIGMIIPSNARLLLGPGQNHFGFVQAVSYNDIRFSRDMIPIITEVDITFRRHVDMAPEDKEFFQTALSRGTQASLVLSSSRELTFPQSNWERLIRAGISSGLGGALIEIAELGWETLGDVAGNVVDFLNPFDNDAANQPGSTKDAPVPSGKITCAYYTYGSAWSCGHHTGEDYSAAYNTPVRATKGGPVIYSGRGNNPGWGTPYGVHVVIESEGIRHLYAHMDRSVVSKGQNVAAGALVGYSSNTGTSSEGGPKNMHLHYEERKKPYQYNVDCRKPIWGNGSG